LVERRSPKPKVGGSRPSAPASCWLLPCALQKGGRGHRWDGKAGAGAFDCAAAGAVVAGIGRVVGKIVG
jgi:hypothetical protein